MKRKMTTGERGWIGLVAYIIAVDSIAWKNQVKHEVKHGRKDETMSVSFGRWLQSPGTRTATGVAWGIVTLHLFLSMPLPGEKTLKHLIQGAVRNKYRKQGFSMVPYNIRKIRKSYSVN